MTKIRTLFLLIAVVKISISYSQDISKFGINIGTYVAIDSASPIGYSMESDLVYAKIVGIRGGSVTVEITNKTNKMLYLSYNDSYFIVNGSTYATLPERTYVKDVNYEVKDDKIAPSTNIKVTMLTRDHDDFFNPIFSNGRAHKSYKTNGVGVSESLVISIKDQDGNRIDHKFVVDVSPIKMVSDYQKVVKKLSKNKNE